MARQSDLCRSLLLYTYTFFLILLIPVNGNGKCSNISYIFSTEVGQDVPPKFCVRDLSCIYNQDKMVISWIPPEDNNTTIDYYIFLNNVTDVSNVSIVKIENLNYKYVEKSIVTETLDSSATLPRIDINTDYNVTVKRRYKEDKLGAAYMISKACTKVRPTTTTSKVTTKKERVNNSLVSTTQTTYRQGNTKQPTEASDKTSSHDPESAYTKSGRTTVPKETNKENVDTGQGTLYIILGLSVAGVVLLIVIVVIIVKLWKKNQSGNENVRQKEKPRTDLENNGPDEEDTYNHLSYNNKDRKTKLEKQTSRPQDNGTDEEGTYNHLSYDNQDRKTVKAQEHSYLKENDIGVEDPYNSLSLDSQEKHSNMAQQSTEDDTYNHLSLSHQDGKMEMMSGKINVVTVSVHAPTTDTINERDIVAANDVTESADGFRQQDSLEDDVMELSRREGPKGDLYTEIEIKK